MAHADSHSSPRRPLHVPIAVQLSGGQVVQTRTIDIGLDGACIASPIPMASNLLGRVWLQLPPLQKNEPAYKLELGARVVHSVLSTVHGFKVSLHFVKPAPPALQALANHLHLGR